MLRATFNGLAITSVLALAACGGGGSGGTGTRTTVLSPARWGSFENRTILDDTTGGTGGDGMLKLFADGLEAVVVGWEHFYDPDENRMHNHVYSGAVRFNVDAFIPASGRKIKRATLSYTVHYGEHTPSAGFFETDPMILRVPLDSSWSGAPDEFPAPPELTTSYFPFLPYIAEEVPVGLMGGTVSLDISQMVKDWADGRKDNTGLVLRSNDFGTMGEIADNDEWWQILRDFHLTIEWTF